MKTVWITLVVTAAIACTLLAGRQVITSPTSRASHTATSPTTSEDLVSRGRYLVGILACADCHTPRNERGQPMPGMAFAGHPEGAPLPQWEPAMMASNALVTIAPPGTAFAGPFGTSVAPNLTPDMETGMGGLSVEGLIESWRTGTHWKSPRPILPPMPADAYKDMHEDDARAVYAYLHSLKPVRNRVPDSILPGAPASPATPQTP